MNYILLEVYVFKSKKGAFMVVANTKENRDIKNVVSTMAIENMFLSKSFIDELAKVSRGEKTSEQLRQEVIQKYAR